eukprot:Selendium_serpulae@DN1063_c0_g1_i1.p2
MKYMFRELQLLQTPVLVVRTVSRNPVRDISTRRLRTGKPPTTCHSIFTVTLSTTAASNSTPRARAIHVYSLLEASKSSVNSIQSHRVLQPRSNTAKQFNRFSIGSSQPQLLCATVSHWMPHFLIPTTA